MFITFEGIDFCGKSTQIEKLKEYLKNNDYQVKLIREPGGTVISEKIRDVLLDKKNNQMVMETEIFLFAASRAQLVREVIRPYLNQGQFVLSDRFHDSSTAYQGYGRGLPIDTIDKINSLAIGETIPDITFLIDISVDEMIKRKNIKGQREADRMESNTYNFFKRVRDGYIEIAYSTQNKYRFKIIDGTQSIEYIHSQITKNIELLIK